MRNKFEIKNCFEFVCPLKWDNLEKTDNKNIRLCGSCDKEVYKASNLESFSKLADENKCVAYIERKGVPTIMGETVPLTYFKSSNNRLKSISDLVSKKS